MNGDDCKCADGQAPFDCTYPQNDVDDSYTKTECEDKKYSAIDYCDESDSPSIYPQSCICIDGNSPEGCVCPQDSKDLIGVPVAQCECCSTGDPRAVLTTPGAGCPEYCTDNIYNGSCACDSDLTDYTECEADKAYILLPDYNGVHGSSVKPNTCKCIDGYSPTGCICPRDTDLNQLDGVSLGQCEYLDEDDPSAGIICPVTEEYISEIFEPTDRGCFCTANYQPDFYKCTSDVHPDKPDGCVCDENKIQLKFNEQSTTISLLKEYLNSYSFIDTSLNPPGSPIGYGKHAVNIFSGLDEINKTAYTNTFDFYESIMILLNNLKDPHIIFTPPCVSKVYYMLPKITVNQSKTDYYLSFIININEQNYSLDKINILGQKFNDNNTYVDVEGTYPTLEAIAIWADEEVPISRNPITRMNYALMNAEHKVNKLLIDLRGNGGGQVRLGRQLLNFLFPNVGHPLYQTVDEIKSNVNEAIANITLYDLDKKPKEAQLPLELDYMEIVMLFYSRGNRKRTTQSEGKNSLTVNLTYKQILYQPQDVLIVTDGACANSCSQFVKHIGEKYLGRIVGVGVSYLVDRDIRFDVGMATSGSVYNYKSDQDIKTNASPPLTQEDKSKLPNKFYRIGTDLSWSNKGVYGFTDETSDQLLEYKIVDADFRVEYFPFDNPNKCLSWEVETNNTQTPNNCKGCLRNVPYSIYGHPCSVRGSSEAKGRYSNGTAKIGEYLTDKCIFSHCKVGYYRQNIVIEQKIDQKCSFVPLGPNQDRIEITPDQTEDTGIIINQCDMLVIVDEQEEQEEGVEEEKQQSDQDQLKEIETKQPKNNAEMISEIVAAGIIVVASIVAMINLKVVIQYQKYSGLGRHGQQLISVDA
ncbi:MAG: hypothetical protein EZS28_014439 [Streblomastix strix]|uniref:Tail specific protease domain-containing protein n=1 Tax=Streblomastix strix TaxID=222440 RepID=A0A5J4W5Q0_9EUKA|nr:MAG: hypothetical protein EZS28_014439 [Streblomastix strix]